MKNKIINFIFAILSSMSIFININLFINIYEFDFCNFYTLNTFVFFIMALFFYILYQRNEKNISKSKIVLSICFSIFMILGECYSTEGSFKIITTNIITLIISIFKLIGYSYLFINIFGYLDKLFKNYKVKDIKVKNKYLKKFIYLFDKYPFRTSFICLFIILGIYYLAFYPIVLSPDPSFQIKMYFNEPTKYIDWVIQRDPNVFMTAHHPVLQTFLIGWSIELGRSILNDNFGLFIYSFGQSIIYLSVLAYTIKFAKTYQIKTEYRLILLLIYMFVPMYLLYSLSAVKDTLYTAFMIIFTLKVFELVKYKDKKFNISFFVVLYFSMLMASLFRHNGVYVVALTIFFLLFYNRKNLGKILITFLLFFTSVLAFDKVLVPSLGISDGSIREMLSVPFQQTARLVKEYPDFYNKKEKKTIDKILKYKTLADRYNPTLADPVKNKFNKETTTDDLIDYFKVWLKGFKHFDVYLDATLNNTYGYMYPNSHSWYVYTKYDDRITENNLVDYYFNNNICLREILILYSNLFPYIPLIGMLTNIGFNTWVILIITVYLISLKKKKYIISLIPLYGSLLFCFLGPSNTYFRYAMPYIFVLPIMFMLLYKEVRK